MPGIPLSDHLVIGKGQFTSFTANALGLCSALTGANHMEETRTPCASALSRRAPTPDGPAVICRLPSGRVALPARLTWNQPPPRPFEVWLVRPCGESDDIAYVKPIRCLAATPFSASTAGTVANRLLLRLARPISALLVTVRRSGRLPASSRTE